MSSLATIRQTYEIWPRLFLGRVPFEGEAFEQDMLVCCEAFLPSGVTCAGGPEAIVHVPFVDGEGPDDVAEGWRLALDLSRQVAIAWRSGKSIRISCLAGLNRSALVMALVLVRLGLSPDHAVERVRWKRESDLCLKNQAFAQHVLLHAVSVIASEPPLPLASPSSRKTPPMIVEMVFDETLPPQPLPSAQQRMNALDAFLTLADTALARCWQRVNQAYPYPRDFPLEDICAPDDRVFLLRLSATGLAVEEARRYTSKVLGVPWDYLDEPADKTPTETLHLSLRDAHAALDRARALVLSWEGDLPVREDSARIAARLLLVQDDLPSLVRLGALLEGALSARTDALKASTPSVP